MRKVPEEVHDYHVECYMQATTDIWTAAKRSEVMSLIRGEETGPEIWLRRALHALGLRYRVHPRDLPGRPDIVFRRPRVAVFVHGCFWHGCPQHYCAPMTRAKFWQRKLAGTRERDNRQRTALNLDGWCVVEFWEHDVESDAVKCAEKVDRIVARRNPSRRGPAEPRSTKRTSGTKPYTPRSQSR